ncbi:fasciclin-like arabinogalactan protein 21 [Papaver somniferum]|uniref:fasciclin-like arabinogalactan protein 21 n=1 Tax=Papaver somniferum TaxID=3469 RepID=UPI000E6F5CDE|nr:fasciclin-like arabinogalactan protein 21 [Papaver somniferum]
MACSCSHWWHAPIYMIITVILAIVAVSPPNPKTHNPPTPPIQHEISSNASLALRNSGFHFMATLLQISPELVLSSSSSSSTFFAIRDETISNLSLPSRLLKDLLKFHTFPSKLTIQDLLNKTENTCLQTLLQGKNVTVTKIDKKQSTVEINGVLISNPGIFNQGPYIIHGVLAPFSPINRHLGSDHFIQSSNCGSISNSGGKSRTRVSWNSILRTLSSNGFVSFAIGLNSVLNNGVHKKQLNMMNSVTIFAPAELSYVASSPSPLLEKIVMIHLVPGRWSYKQLLAASSSATPLTTLVPDIDLQITKFNSSTTENEEILSVNGVDITAPDVLHSNGFIIHRISRPIGMAKLSQPHVRSFSD